VVGAPGEATRTTNAGLRPAETLISHSGVVKAEAGPCTAVLVITNTAISNIPADYRNRFGIDDRM
jgi:hypothetical protein